MTDDQLPRNINFIVAQQAQFAAGIERLKEVQERTQQQLEATQKQLEKNQQQIYDISGAVVTVVRLYGDLDGKGQGSGRSAKKGRGTASRHRRTPANLH